MKNCRLFYIILQLFIIITPQKHVYLWSYRVIEHGEARKISLEFSVLIGQS